MNFTNPGLTWTSCASFSHIQALDRVEPLLPLMTELEEAELTREVALISNAEPVVILSSRGCCHW